MLAYVPAILPGMKIARHADKMCHVWCCCKATDGRDGDWTTLLRKCMLEQFRRFEARVGLVIMWDGEHGAGKRMSRAFTKYS